MGYDVYGGSEDPYFHQERFPGKRFDANETGTKAQGVHERLHIAEVKHRAHGYDPAQKTGYDEKLVGKQRPNWRKRIADLLRSKMMKKHVDKQAFTDSSKIQCRQPGEYWEYGYFGQRKEYYENGQKYTAKHGFGTFKYKNGGIYVGYFEDHLMCGHGVFVDCKGNRYQGNFKDDHMDGFGHYTYVNGDSYKGDFKRGQFHGKGLYEWASGNSYDGPFINGVMGGEGIAEYRYASGSYYKGGYKYGEKSGQGAFYHSNGDTYKGGFLEGMMHGNGEYE